MTSHLTHIVVMSYLLIRHLENTEKFNTKRLKIGYLITEHVQHTL